MTTTTLTLETLVRAITGAKPGDDLMEALAAHLMGLKDMEEYAESLDHAAEAVIASRGLLLSNGERLPKHFDRHVLELKLERDHRPQRGAPTPGVAATLLRCPNWKACRCGVPDGPAGLTRCGCQDCPTCRGEQEP